MSTDQKTWTVNAIKDANRAAGYHWFDPDTMRMFGTKVLPTVYQGPGGVYFVTQDDNFDRTKRAYTVRRFDPATGDVDTVGELNGTANLAKARLKALNLARAAGKLSEVKQTADRFRPVTVLEQFLADLRKHGNPAATESDARKLIRLAGRHHKYMEGQCNGKWPYKDWNGENGHPPIVESCRGEARTAAARVGAVAVLFSGDPRGATVKLKFKDGATNDFGSEGWIVPTSEKDDE